MAYLAPVSRVIQKKMFDLARFWPYHPSLRGYDPFIRGSLVKGSHMRPLVKGKKEKVVGADLQAAFQLPFGTGISALNVFYGDAVVLMKR